VDNADVTDGINARDGAFKKITEISPETSLKNARLSKARRGLTSRMKRAQKPAVHGGSIIHASRARSSAKERLLMRLAPELSRLCNATIAPADIQIFPAQGYWRQCKADVMQWTGTFSIGTLTHDIGCWESVTDCLRYGFTIKRGSYHAYADFEVSSKK
jgi:hypothetical protein